MTLWRKTASAAWLEQYESALDQLAPGRVCVIGRPGRLRLTIEIACRTGSAARNLVRRFGGTTVCLPRDWRRSYQSPTHAPIRLGRRLTIVSEAEGEWDRDRLIIPAAGAFGTGEHATTAMSLRLLEVLTRRWPAGWRMLDAGTGTAILALAARRFGAGEVLAIDSDPRALANARQNARRNHVRGVRFLRRDLLVWKPDREYDVITANLFSELLIAALPIFRRALVSRGSMILSGILREQEPEILRWLDARRFDASCIRRRGKWIALLARSIE